ncbi:MAG: L,D-transpeptidase family protein [Candidatus Omnitrophota bacterium]
MKRKLLLAILAAIAVLVILAGLILKGKQGFFSSANRGNTNSSSSLFAKARTLEEKGSLLEAKSAYQRLINDFPNAKEIAEWQRKAEDINIKLLFSPILIPKSVIYEIKPGDSLTKIAREFKTTTELIQKSNNLTDDKIFPGKKIKVWTAPFNIIVDKSQNLLILKTDEEIIKTYTVSTGLNNSTPVGNFRIVNKIQNPTWFKAGAVVPASSPENILGSRWLGFDIAGYGIHGTTEPQNLGKQVTQGCVRMSNQDVEELYAVVAVGTGVTIVD